VATIDDFLELDIRTLRPCILGDIGASVFLSVVGNGTPPSPFSVSSSSLRASGRSYSYPVGVCTCEPCEGVCEVWLEMLLLCDLIACRSENLDGLAVAVAVPQLVTDISSSRSAPLILLLPLPVDTPKVCE
jgi:hypothetical protein